MKKLLILLLTVTLLVSCNKDNEELTAAELLAQEIQTTMDSDQTTRLVCLMTDDFFESLNLSASSSYGTDYSFSGQSVYSEGTYYNLNNLVMYEILRTTDGTEYMVLYF
jgi:hypothetical protein